MYGLGLLTLGLTTLGFSVRVGDLGLMSDFRVRVAQRRGGVRVNERL